MIKGYARISTLYPLGGGRPGARPVQRIVYGTRVSLTVALIGR